MQLPTINKALRQHDLFMRLDRDGKLIVEKLSELDAIKADFHAILSKVPLAAKGLRQAIVGGKIELRGTSGCCCLVCTIAAILGKDVREVLTYDEDRPAMKWFDQLKQGDKPNTNSVAALSLEWLDDWQCQMREASRQGNFGGETLHRPTIFSGYLHNTTSECQTAS